MNDVIKYTATSASDDVTDMYDHDNFYPMDGEYEGEYLTGGGGSYDGLGEVYDTTEYGNFSGLDADGEGLDIEYSEAFGDFMKKIGTGIRGAVDKFKARGGGKAARKTGRETKRSARNSL